MARGKSLHGSGDGLDRHNSTQITGKENIKLSDNNFTQDEISKTGGKRRREGRVFTGAASDSIITIPPTAFTFVSYPKRCRHLMTKLLTKVAVLQGRRWRHGLG